MRYEVKPEYIGKIRLDDENRSVVLNADTPQDELARLYQTGPGKQYIDEIPFVAPAEQ